MGFELVGKVWDGQGFQEYLEEVNLSWANSVTVHHTASPTLAQRPSGWKIQHMRNLAHYYGQVLGWSAGPHLFTDEDEIYGLSSLWKPGVHARSFNRYSIGIEALGNYDTHDDPKIGRGLDVWHTTAEAVAILLSKLGSQPNDDTVLFHRDDPKTNKTCPGRKVEKDWFLDLVAGYMNTPPPLTLEDRVARIEKHLGI